MKRYHKLKQTESQIILQKGTEAAGSGALLAEKRVGIYLCRQCDQALYESSSKFSSGCGWPSFDEEITGAVLKHPDPDGIRVEIICANCQGHLGHVFVGEGFTDKNTRHCVNSASMSFNALKTIDGYERAIFAGGCFWGVQYFLAQVPGVLEIKAGYCGGHVVEPSYDEVCSGLSGHAECVEVIFDQNQLDFKSLAKLFFEAHDPTLKDQQGPDHGPQYRSEIFYLSSQQRIVALELIDLLKTNNFAAVTKISPASHFYAADDYHQSYYQKNGQEPYCHSRIRRFFLKNP